MKIVVAVKQVAALDEEFELLGDGSGVDEEFIEWELNEWDTFSLEAALRLHEGAGVGGEVVAVTVGDEEAEEGVLACLARGADRGVRVWDDSLQGADPLQIARVLAAVVERESPDLVLCGVQSSDAVTGSTGAALAGYLDMPRVAVVSGLSYDAQSSTLTIDRELEGGLVEVMRIGLPALLTIQTGINEPRYATLRAIKQAREKPLERLTPDELGLDPASLQGAGGARTTALRMPDRGEGAQLLDGSPAEVAERIVELVQERMSG